MCHVMNYIHQYISSANLAVVGCRTPPPPPVPPQAALSLHLRGEYATSPVAAVDALQDMRLPPRHRHRSGTTFVSTDSPTPTVRSWGSNFRAGIRLEREEIRQHRNTCFRVGRRRHAAVPCRAIVATYHGSASYEWVKPWGLVEDQPISPSLRHPVRFIELAFSGLAPRIARKRPSRLCRGSVYFGKP